MISITYPGSRTYSYEYDVAGNLLHLRDNAAQNNVVAYSIFTALGQPRQANFSNSVSTTYDYYPKTARLHTLLTQKPGNPTYQNLIYQYDQKGNIINLNDQKNGITHTYGYDSLDRLDWAKGYGGNIYIYDHNYDYDRIGNITFKTDVGVYVYDYGNKPHAVRSAGPFTLTYDANGNMTARTGGGVGDISIPGESWDYDNKPTMITKGTTTVSFTYDGNGQRVKKESSLNGTTLYFGGLYEVRGGVEVLHLFAGNRRVASIRTDGKHQFYHPNHIGSASFITASNGDPKEQIEYHPFGTYRDVGSPTGTYDYDPDFPDVYYTYTGQEDDDDLGLYNYGARLYDPVLGRFISPDRLVPDPGDPQALNRYTYCLNNPLIYTDPSGEIIDLLAVIFVASIVAGAVVGGIQAYRSGQNVFVGALIGAAISAVSALVGYGVGSAVTSWLTPTVQTATNAAAVSAAEYAGMYAGAFAGGATAGGLNAAVYGGNVWQGALYGGLTAVAIAGLVHGAIELNDWANGTDIGGGKATGKLMPKDVKPDTELPQWKFEDLFNSEPGGLKEYLEPRPGHPHSGIDVKPRSLLGVNKPFQGLAPGKIAIESFGPETGYGDTINATAVGYSKNLIIKFAHGKIIGDLKVGSIVEKGTPFFESTLTGNISGYHTHISVIYESNYYNPRFIFK